MTVSELNSLTPADFSKALAGVYEHSSWIGSMAEKQRPFADVESLWECMQGIVAESRADEQLALIRAHPDLGGRLAQQGKLTRESALEQSSAGLADAGAAVLARLATLNNAYRSRFGFPFIICARLNQPDAILAAMEKRLSHAPEEEIAAALEEIGKIARLRLSDLITS